MGSKGKVVCVTGASGFIATWLVKELLQRGYTVRASVRDPCDPKKTNHLRVLHGAEERLHLYKANLLEDGSFDEIVDGCDCVFHTASPFVNDADPVDPQAELLDPAVKGTLNVLASCQKASVAKVIVTSSLAAVIVNKKPNSPGFIFDETSFSDPQFCEQIKMWYVLSKTLAEEAAWKFSKEHGINLITINPGMVVGPLLQPTLNTSSAGILNLIDGTPTFPNVTMGWVDVRDVAMAHVLAFESPSANGRYCLVEAVAHYSDVLKIIHELYPHHLKLADKCADDNPFPPAFQVSKEKAKSLGVEFRPLKASLKDAIESLREKGFVTF